MKKKKDIYPFHNLMQNIQHVSVFFFAMKSFGNTLEKKKRNGKRKKKKGRMDETNIKEIISLSHPFFCYLFL